MKDIIMLKPMLDFKGVNNTSYEGYTIRAWVPFDSDTYSKFSKLISEFEGIVMGKVDDKISNKPYFMIDIYFNSHSAANCFYLSYLLEVKE